MTSLAHQLQRLALPGAPAEHTGRRTQSLLFLPAEAAEKDRETIFAIGCTGLEQLVSIDPFFSNFGKSLFSTAAIGLERSVQGREANKYLDERIELFLTRLSPFFLLKPAQKCLEWLVNRFHIHRYNENSLLACAIPFHESPQFVRVVQLLRIKDPTHRWHWLFPLQKHKVPLARSTLVTHCYKDPIFADFLCCLALQAVKVFGNDDIAGCRLHVLFSFISTSLVAALEKANPVTESFIAKLTPFIHVGFHSCLPDFRCTAYMVVAQLAVRSSLDIRFANTLILLLSRSLRLPSTSVLSSVIDLQREGLTCLLVLLHNQPITTLPKKAFSRLCRIPHFVQLLQQLGEAYDTKPLLKLLIPQVISALFSNTELSDTSYQEVLQQVIADIPLDEEMQTFLIRNLLETYMKKCEEHGGDGDVEEAEEGNEGVQAVELKQRVAPLFHALEQRFARSWDNELGKLLPATLDSPARIMAYQDIVTFCLTGRKHQAIPEAGVSLMLALNHTAPAVRILGLRHLQHSTNMVGFEEGFIDSVVFDRLDDDSPGVVVEAIKVLEKFQNRFKTDVMVSLLVKLVRRARNASSPEWIPVMESACIRLSTREVLELDPTQLENLLQGLLPQMLLMDTESTRPGPRIVVGLARSALCKKHPLFCGWEDVLEKPVKSDDPLVIISAANQQLVVLLAQNLVAMDRGKRKRLVCLLESCTLQDQEFPRERMFALLVPLILCEVMQLLHSDVSQKAEAASLAVRVVKLVVPPLEKLMLKKRTAVQWSPGNEELAGAGSLQLLISVVENVRSGHLEDQHNAFVFVHVLRRLIQTLPPHSTFAASEKLWIEPALLHEADRDSLALLTTVFDLAVLGTCRRGPGMIEMQEIIKLILKHNFCTSLDRLRFLVYLWARPRGLLSSAARARAFCVGGKILASSLNHTTSDLMILSALLVLLGAMNSSRESIRVATLPALTALATHKLPWNLKDLVFLLMDAHSDIQKDAQQVVQITGYVFKSKSSVTASTLSILLDCLAKDDCPPDVAHAALCCLAEIDGLVILSKLLPVLERLLQRIVPRDHNSEETSIDGFSMAEAKLLSWALSKINTSSAKLLATEPRAMAILLLAIKAPASVTLPLPGQPRLQTIALRLITKKFFTALPSAALQRTVLSAMFDLLVDCRNPQTMHDVGFVFKGLSLNADMVAEELCLPKPIGRRTVLQRRRTNQKKTLCVEAGETQESPCEAGTQAEQQTRAWCRVTLILEMLQTKKKIQQPGMLLPALFGMLASCLESKDVETEDLEYPKQLVLACLQNICSRLKPGAASEVSCRELVLWCSDVCLEGNAEGKRDSKNIDLIDRLEDVLDSAAAVTLVWHKICYAHFMDKSKI
uniref:HEAT repeat-containing protein 1 n=1 Tax=Myxine glutinosa TaxID=7769 RepID=UPI00358EF475